MWCVCMSVWDVCVGCVCVCVRACACVFVGCCLETNTWNLINTKSNGWR